MILPVRIINLLFLTGYALMAVGMVFSNFLMSLSQFVLAGAWILDGNLPGKFTSYFRNRTALSLSVIFFIHVAGLAWTSDFDYGFRDLRVKLPLFILPLIISTSPPLSKKWFDFLATLFIASVSTATIISTSELIGFNNLIREYLNLPQHILFDNRSISLFISHIRFSLLVCVAICFIIYRLCFSWVKFNHLISIMYTILILWMCIFLFLLESLTGIVIISAIIGGVLLQRLFININLYRKILPVIGLLALISFWIYTFKIIYDNPCINRTVSYSGIETHTRRGNPYSHDTTAGILINCNPVWVNICWMELSYAWTERSGVSFEGMDLKGQPVKYTLINYLTSKGLKKDEDGVNSLNSQEIAAIEKGLTDYRAMHIPDFKFRLEKIAEDYREYTRGSNPAGSSVIQRFEFWKAAWSIIRENPFTGAGTGDVIMAYKEQYRKTNSIKNEKWQLRAHNQYLAIGVSLGIPGMLCFIAALFYPLLANRRNHHFMYITFFITAIISFLNEDTLESQAGISFFAFFSCLFLFKYPEENRP